jgi:hypothetical protein
VRYVTEWFMGWAASSGICTRRRREAGVPCLAVRARVHGGARRALVSSAFLGDGFGPLKSLRFERDPTCHCLNLKNKYEKW